MRALHRAGQDHRVRAAVCLAGRMDGVSLRPAGVADAALAASRDRGAEEMHIGVDEVDADARRFYERHGFSNLEPGTSDRMLFYERTL